MKRFLILLGVLFSAPVFAISLMNDTRCLCVINSTQFQCSNQHSYQPIYYGMVKVDEDLYQNTGQLAPGVSMMDMTIPFEHELAVATTVRGRSYGSIDQTLYPANNMAYAIWMSSDSNGDRRWLGIIDENLMTADCKLKVPAAEARGLYDTFYH